MQAIVTDIGVANGLGVVFKPASGEPVLVSDFRTILPGESAPTSAHFETTPVRGGVAFVAQSTFDRLGVYWWQPGSGISLVANLDTMVPGTSQQFTGFFATIGWDDGLVFSGWSSLGGGFYLVREPGAPIEPLVVPGDITADGEILATVYGNPGGPSRGAGALLVFTAFTVGNPEVAAFVRTQTGEIHRLLRVGDEVDGRIVEDIYAVGASRDAVALRVGFGVGNRDTAIYRADFPEPSQGVVEIPTMRSIGRLSFLVLVALTGLILLRRAPS